MDPLPRSAPSDQPYPDHDGRDAGDPRWRERIVEQHRAEYRGQHEAEADERIRVPAPAPNRMRSTVAIRFFFRSSSENGL